MHYSPINTNNAAPLYTANQDRVFVGLARHIDRTQKARGYSTDEYMLHSTLVPAVYRDRCCSRYFAGYVVADHYGHLSADTDERLINETAVYPDRQTAAVAADKFADGAASLMCALRPEPRDEEWELIRKRRIAPGLRGGLAALEARANGAS